MIRSLTLKNYKSFKDETTIDIKPITILVGPNSSGKSSIINALSLLHQSFNEGYPGSYLNYNGSNGEFGSDITIAHKRNVENVELGFKADSFYPDGMGFTYYGIPYYEMKNIGKDPLRSHQFYETNKPIENYFDFNLSMLNGEHYLTLSVADNVFTSYLNGSYQSTIQYHKTKYISNIIKNGLSNIEVDRISTILKNKDEEKGLLFEKLSIIYGSSMLGGAFSYYNRGINYLHQDYFEEPNTHWLYEFGSNIFKILDVGPFNETWLDKGIELLNVKELPGNINENIIAIYLERRFPNLRNDMIETFEQLIKSSLTFNLSKLAFFAPLRPLPKRQYSLLELQSLFPGYDTKNDNLLKNVSQKLNSLGIKEEIICESLISQSTGETFYSLLLKSNSFSINIADVGFGVSQLIPILAGLSTLTELSTNKSIVVQEPELHLHPNVQSKFSEIVYNSLFDWPKDSSFVLMETHSEHIIRGFQVLVAQGKLKPEDIAIYYVDKNDGVSSVNKLPLDEKGFFTEDWPKGFMDVIPNQLDEIWKSRV